MERFRSFLASHLPIDSVAAFIDNCRLLKTFQCVWVWMDVGFTLNWKCWGVGEAAYREFSTVGSSLSLYLSVPC